MIMTRRLPDIAVIGAGIAGLSCAELLAESGLPVHVFDKGRRPGGRVAERNRLGLTFRHGAPEGHELVARLLRRIKVGSGHRVRELERRDDGQWLLHFDDQPSRGPFAGVVLAVPAPQAAILVAPFSDLDRPLAAVVMRPVLTALVCLPGPLGRGWSHIRVGDASLEEARRQAVRHALGPEGWVLHATPTFSQDNLECDPHAVAQHLWLRFRKILDLAMPTPLYLRGHRWRYGRTDRPLGQPCLLDEDSGLGLCGDWCLDDGTEAARASGRALAAQMLGLPGRPVHKALTTREGQA
jgi:predicted NAD/FAD-dependent oxidoreductase